MLGVGNQLVEMETYMDAFEKLDSIANLEEGWDGADAPPIGQITIAKTREILSENERIGVIGEPDRVIPSPDGSIMLAWVTPDGLREMEIDEKGKLHLYF